MFSISIVILTISAAHLAQGIAYRQDFDGFCRKSDGSKDYIKDLQTKNVGSCYQTCKDTSGCVAFAFTPSSDKNCDLYKGGPYTKGSGKSGSKCYTMEPKTMYATTESGQECNGNLMSTQEECEAAISQIQHLIPGAYFAGSLSMADRPTGCFYHPGGTSIYWNTNALGKSCSSCRSVCKQSNGKCFDVAITTKSYGSENSWTVGACTSARGYQNSQTYTESCCLDAGSYKLTCDDSYKDGWHGGFIEIQGKRYCEDFTSGHQQENNVDISYAVNGGWGVFGDWEECPVSCGGADRKRYRQCNNPVPEHGGNDCTADGSTNVETERCNENPCPVNGGWGGFGDWEECSVSCGGAEHSRYRECNNPAPAHGGHDCTADGSTNVETEACNETPCPVNGGWGEFSEWDECAVSCGGAEHSRHRECNNPSPAHGGHDCTADGSTNVETETCNENPCPVNGGWGEFGDWEECSVSCGGAEHSRHRECNNPAPAHGGQDCTADGSNNVETERCNENPCPVNGGWGGFGDWEECPVSCGGAEHSRYRECNNPIPEHGGNDCTIDGSTNVETEKCNENPCPVNGAFSAWDDWTPCTAQCGGGDQTRTRRCDSPAPQHGGEDCVGELTECQRCNTDLCPSTCPA